MTKPNRRSRVNRLERQGRTGVAPPLTAGEEAAVAAERAAQLEMEASPPPSPSLAPPPPLSPPRFVFPSVSAAASALFNAVDESGNNPTAADTTTTTISSSHQAPERHISWRPILKPKGPSGRRGPAPSASGVPEVAPESSAAAASASPAIFSPTPPSASTFSFNAESQQHLHKMLFNAETQLAKAREAKDGLESYYHNQLADRDTEIHNLRGELQSSNRQLGELRAGHSAAEQQSSDLQKQLDSQREENEKIQAHQASIESIKREYSVYKAQTDRHLQTRTQEYNVLKSKFDKARLEILEAQGQLMDAQKDMAEMKKQEIASARAFEANEQVKAQLDKALTDFAAVFPDVGQNVSIDEFVIATRNLKAFYAQKEEEARDRESSHEGTHQPPSSSIQDELDRAAIQGDDHDGDDADDSENDPADNNATHALHVEKARAVAAEALVESLQKELQQAKEPAKHTTPQPHQLSLSNISTVDASPVQADTSNTTPQPQPQQFGFSNISTVETSPVEPDTSLTPSNTSQNLDFGPITSLTIDPTPPHRKTWFEIIAARKRPFTFSEIKSVETTPIPPAPVKPQIETVIKTVIVPEVTTVYKTPTYTQMWQGAAWHIKLFLISAFVLYMSLNMMLAREYSIWINANDITRQYIFDLTNDHYESLLPSPIVHSIGEFLGVDFTILG